MKKEPCSSCPCPDACSRRNLDCQWASEIPRDENKISHICGRGKLSSIPAVIVGAGGSIHKVPPDADPSQYPGVIAQAGNFIGAMGRVAQAALHGQQITVPAEILESRRAICLPCEFNGERARDQIRCMKCGCSGVKLMLATEKCPIDKWMTWTPPEKEDPPSQMT